MNKFFEELKRRNVIKASLAYLVIAWVLLQVLSLLLPMVSAPEWLLPTLTLIMAIGLPIWIIISWIYEITPEGVEKTAKVSENELASEITNKRLNIFIIVSLSIAVIVMGLKLSNFFSDSDKQFDIAILPFDSMIVDEGNEWLSAGFTLDINTYLSKIKKIHVISDKSSNKYKDSDKTNPEIAKELDVSYLLRGTVRQVKNKIIITVRLIDVNTDEVWSYDYEESFEENALNIQQQISQKIVEELKIKLSPEEEKILEKFPTKNMEAYKLFVKGNLINNSRKKEDMELNIELNKQAIALDSNFTEAYAEIGQSTFLLAFYYADYNEGVKKAMPYLEKALQLDPNTARALAGKAMIVSNAGNWEEAKEYFKKAIAIYPSDATIHYQYATHLFGRDLNKHLIILAMAQQLDPLSALIGHQYFVSLMINNKIEEAEKYFGKYRFIFTKPGEQLEKESVIIAYKNKDWTAALRFLENEIKKDPNNATLNRKLGEAYDGILLDNSNYIKYTKKAYELDSTNEVNRFEYYQALFRGRKFKKVIELIQSQNSKSLISKSEELNYLFEYYYQQENYKKAQDLLKDTLMYAKDYNKAMISAQLGDRNAVIRFLKNINYYPEFEVPFYAALEEKDTMYFYLEKITGYRYQRHPLYSERYGLRSINSMRVFDAYRKEERYKALLRKHYLPITHWNE